MLGYLSMIPVRAAQIVYTNRNAAYYAVTCICIFTLIYYLMGTKKHFDIPEYLAGREDSWLTSLYTSALAQSNAMPDTAPKTNVARVLFMLQVCSGWFWFLLFT